MAFRNMNDIYKYELTDVCCFFVFFFSILLKMFFFFPLFILGVLVFLFVLFSLVFLFVHFTKLTGEAECCILSQERDVIVI